MRDSAGVTIVEHSAAALERLPEWSVAAEPDLTIGASADPADDLTEVAGGYLTPAGEIVVAEGSAREIRIYAPDGSLRRTLGRQGTGPGEYSALTSVWRQGDSTAVFDMSARRLTVAPNDGSMPRVIPLGRTGLLESVQGTAGGRLVTWRLDGDSLMAVGSGSVRVPQHVLVISSDGAAVDTVLSVDGPLFYLPSASPGWSGPAPVGLGPDTRMRTIGDSIVIGTNNRYELVTYDLAGRPVRIVRMAVPARAVEEDDVEFLREAEWEEFQTRFSEMPAEIVAQYRGFLENQRYAETMPYYDMLAADPAGNLWVQDFPRPAERYQRFTVIAPDGALLARVRLPDGVELLSAGDSAIVGVWRDQDDVPRVSRYRLTRE
ncbi:MAG TPA: hypothetical protein VK012_07350 [Gemmatimonadales bacterium]|nr:hypothetical protein [Gemmatimonadales bacterium]